MTKVLAEGKTKQILATEDLDQVLIVSKDDITAGDGTSREVIKGKAEVATTTTCNVFELLELEGIPNHYLAKGSDDVSFRALRAKMIPVEVVLRRVATGSYLKRNPGTKDGKIFPLIEYELFWKDDARHDPIIQIGEVGTYELYDPSQPLSSETLLQRFNANDEPVFAEFSLDEMRVIALEVFLALEEAWLEFGVILYDLKIEFGLVSDGAGGFKLVVADVIDNDSWRIKDADGKQLDKQVFRDAILAGGASEEDLGKIADNYQLVAELSGQFSRLG